MYAMINRYNVSQRKKFTTRVSDACIHITHKLYVCIARAKPRISSLVIRIRHNARLFCYFTFFSLFRIALHFKEKS